MLRYRLVAFIFRCFRWLPAPAAYVLAAFMAELMYLINASARAVVYEHLRYALGPRATPGRLRVAARACFRASGYYYVELARTPLLRAGDFQRTRLRMHNFHHIEQALATGKGVIVAAMHYGNPELVAQSMKARGIYICALAEPLKPPALYDLVAGLRASQGHEFYPVGRLGLRQVIRRLRAGGVLCIMADRDIQGSGEVVPFLGGCARVPIGPVDLARHTGAALIPTVAARRGFQGFDLYAEPPIEITRTTDPDADRRVNAARLMAAFEPYVRRDPGQWWVIQSSIFVDNAAGCRNHHPTS